MTFTITMDWFVYLYYLIESYVHLYCTELKIQSRYSYFDRMADLPIHEVVATAPTNIITFPVNPVKEPEVLSTPTQIELDDKTNSLFEELQQELFTMDLPADDVYETGIFITNTDCSHNYSEFNDNFLVFSANDEEEDCIHMQDLIEEPTAVNTGYEEFASAKISDAKDGAQQWVVQVVGIEQDYIHVTDGKRIWLHVGELVNKIRNKDVLKLDVLRDGKNVTVENLYKLETGVSEEYLIPDEYVYENDLGMAM